MHWIRTLTTLLLLTGTALLAYEPLAWLLGSWYLPGYPRSGPVVFALVVLLFGYSLSSQPMPAVQGSRQGSRQGSSVGFGLLLVSACVRAAAQVADINMLGALVLAVDVYALALLFGTSMRSRAVAPFWLAVLFCFCLPLEPWLQRLLGSPLQWLSAQGACGLLVLVADDVVCNNLRLSVHGVEVLVDLACSGSRLLIQASLLLSLLFALARPTWRQVGTGVLLSLFAVWLLNACRIALITLGLVHKPWGLDVMAPMVHSGIGLFCFALLALILFCWMWRDRRFEGWKVPVDGSSTPVDSDSARHVRAPTAPIKAWKGLVGAVGFVALVQVIVQLESKPLDRTATMATPYLPAVLAGHTRRAAAITEQERNYYQTYGGAAAKAGYGSNGLLLVRTGAPIRHLHAPDVCLGGMGFQVDFMGTDLSPIPTAVYRAQRKSSGEVWQVRVSYVADSGEVTASLSELAWRWVRSPGTRWTMVQRLVPWPEASPQGLMSPGHPQARLVPKHALAWEQAVLRAFNLFSPSLPAIQLTMATPVAPTFIERKPT